MASNEVRYSSVGDTVDLIPEERAQSKQCGPMFKYKEVLNLMGLTYTILLILFLFFFLFQSTSIENKLTRFLQKLNSTLYRNQTLA